MKDGGKRIEDFSWKRGGGKDIIQELNRCAFELSFWVPNYLSTGLCQGFG